MPRAFAGCIGGWRAVRLIAGLVVLATALAGMTGEACGAVRLEQGRRGGEEGRQGRRLQRHQLQGRAQAGRCVPGSSTASPVEVLDGRASEIRERIRTEQAAGRFIGDVGYTGATSVALQTAEGAFKPHGGVPLGNTLAEPFTDNGTFVPVERRQLRAAHQHQSRQGGHQELEGAGGPEVGRQDPERRSARPRCRPGLVRGDLPHARPRRSTRRSPPTSR